MLKATTIVGTALLLLGQIASTPAAAQTVRIPNEETIFCSILEAANQAYQPIRSQWYDEKNGILRDRIGVQLEQLVDARNVRVLADFGWKAPFISKWVIKITAIRTSHFAPNQVDLEGSFPCGITAPFKAGEISATPRILAFPADKKIGDHISVTAFLMMHDATVNPPQKALEWSLTQGGSMASPEYRLDIKEMTAAP